MPQIPRKARNLVAFALVASANACVPNFDDDVSTVAGPRVLSIQASPAEAPPGASVTLSALVATPDGSPSSLHWQLCSARKPLTELGPVNPDCLLQSGGDRDASTPLGDGDTVTVQLPKDACQIFGPIRPPAVAGQAQGRPVDPDITGGYYQPVTASLTGTDQVTLGAVRLACPLTDATPAALTEFGALYRPNQNPEISSLELRRATGESLSVADGDSVTVQPGELVTFDVAWPECPVDGTCEDGICSACGDGICGANETKSNCASDCTMPTGCRGAETYPVFDRSAQDMALHRESMRISWYASRGTFRNPVTGRAETESVSTSQNAWTAPTAAGSTHFWLVIRDARGGQSFRSFIVTVPL